jgi:hypothetical protein
MNDLARSFVPLITLFFVGCGQPGDPTVGEAPAGLVAVCQVGESRCRPEPTLDAVFIETCVLKNGVPDWLLGPACAGGQCTHAVADGHEADYCPCAAGDVFCSWFDRSRGVCDANNHWHGDGYCDCLPGQVKCDSSSFRRSTCDAHGDWQPSGVCGFGH